MSGWLPFLLVGAGGFLGAIARYMTARWVGTWVDARFSLGTFLVNVGGSFLLELSTDLPIVVEIVDAEDTIKAFLPIVDELVTEGMVTLEAVRILTYVASPAQG